MAGWNDTSLAYGWTSVQMCVDELDMLRDLLDDDTGPLVRAIRFATDDAQTYLRPRWPDQWPFSEPPEAIQVCVADMAIQRIVRSRADRSLETVLIEWDKARADAVAKLKAIAAEQETILTPVAPGFIYHNLPHVAPPCDTEMGFNEG